MNDLLSKLRVASAVIGNLPEQPGYNGSILTIDNREAFEVEKAIDAGVMEIERLRAALRIAQRFCNSLSAEDCPDSVAIPIYEALIAPNAQGKPTAKLGRWMPIETAPANDKSDYFFAIVAWGPDKDQTTGYAVRYNGEWFAGALFYNGARYNERQFSFREHPIRPTHWMPKPEAPNA